MWLVVVGWARCGWLMIYLLPGKFWDQHFETHTHTWRAGTMVFTTLAVHVQAKSWGVSYPVVSTRQVFSACAFQVLNMDTPAVKPPMGETEATRLPPVITTVPHIDPPQSAVPRMLELQGGTVSQMQRDPALGVGGRQRCDG